MPLNAAREDINGYFILFAEAQEGHFGSSYIMRRHQFEPGRSDNENVAITSR